MGTVENSGGFAEILGGFRGWYRGVLGGVGGYLGAFCGRVVAGTLTLSIAQQIIATTMSTEKTQVKIQQVQIINTLTTTN